MTAVRDIERLLASYFDALYFCDVETLRRAFHPRAIYATADETPISIRSFDEYAEVVSKRASPASRNEQRRDQVESIELAGDNTALARVRCSIGARDFVDFLSLVRVDGAWRIIAKVFQIIERKQ